jgi:hypothetical protein
VRWLPSAHEYALMLAPSSTRSVTSDKTIIFWDVEAGTIEKRLSITNWELGFGVM